MSVDVAERIAVNLQSVRERITAAARSDGRSPSDINLIAVTKYASMAAVEALVAAGHVDLGESRPQQLWDRAPALAGRGIRWHFIGHLQRNKVRRTVPLMHLIHSGDSLRLLEELDRETAAAQRSRLPVLLEVNISGETAKHGFAPAEMPPICDALAKLSYLDIQGLMCMAGLEDDPAGSRRDFAKLRELRDRLRMEWAGRFALDDLSMGMSGDFEAAIAEGSTMVRIGSALFEGLDDAERA